MFSRQYDILFFFAPIAFGIFVYLLSKVTLDGASALWIALIINAFGAGPFHQGPTLFFFWDKEHRAHFASTRKKQFIFFVCPALIMVASILGMFYCQWLTYLIAVAWAIQHLVQQNIGILLLYHNWKRGEAIVPKQLEIISQWAPAIFFSAVFAYRTLLSGPGNLAIHAILAILGIWATFCVATYITTMRKLYNQGASINAPALAFWVCSVLSLLPLSFLGSSFDEAFLIPVTAHWFQYIGLNYSLVKEKYVNASSANLPSLSPLLLFFGTCVVLLTLGIGIASFKVESKLHHEQSALLLAGGILVGLANVHYFLDAFIWRFRESYQRESVLPFLLKPREKKKWAEEAS